MNLLLTTEKVYGFARIAEFYEKGGSIMYVLTLCSIITVAVIVYKIFHLSQKRVLPNSFQHPSVLQRLRQVASKQKLQNPAQIRESLQAEAHAELVKLQSGIGILEVVIVVSPLLGLLGTASGITTVFDGLSSLEDVKMNLMAAGVAEALFTTIAGLAVAVPAVVAHSYFNRRIEKYAAQLEVVVSDLVQSSVQQVEGEEG